MPNQLTLTFLKTLNRKIFTVGIQPGQSFSKKRDIVFTNEVIFFLSLVSIVTFLIDFSIGHTGRSLVNLSVFVLLLPGYLLQARKQYDLAKAWIIFVPTIMAISSAFIFGFNAKAHFYTFSCFILSLIMFQDLKHHIAFFVLFVPLMFGLLFVEDFWVPFIAGQDPTWMKLVHLPLVILSVFVTLREYAIVFKSFESKVVDLVGSIQEKNAELQAQKDFIEDQTLALQNTNRELQKSVREHEKTERLLRASNENLEHFAYMASHDLKEPLRTVGSFTSLIQRRLKDKSTTEINEYFSFVNSGVKRMSTLLDDVLSLSRIKKEVTFEWVDLNHILSAVKMNLDLKLKENDTTFILPHLPETIGNKVLLTQLFQNLISNGIKFRRDENPIIEISFTENEKAYIFTVSDNGIGVAKEYQQKVFQIFQRLHDRAKFEGSGIGLAICQKIVENHGGKIWMESEEGVGTKIHFTLSKELNAEHTVDEMPTQTA